MNLDDLDKKLWKKLKSNAGIKSSGFFKKADASVGKYISAAVKARDKFADTYLAEDLLKYQDALKKLDEAFDKFVTTKHLDDIDDGDLKANEKKELASEIESWREQIDKLIKGLDSGVKTLYKGVGGDWGKFDQAEKGKRKVVMDKTFDQLGF
ncbi:hypothetical protein Psta_0231 [Pirellula staleyi DSM 6068]|uniref:Uncharacterized protein n=1 Tax=Pirellula staleyi (strain ATCC 27377 / DSM 6068 / ICPB 4128) TaxID=530564 RepID=D2R1E2_PIRSD|nr:hypothetical protein [Pirellula staleyi]ADB14927.1 hypothetical protein Psta_0231 [Pirellula staleyi DSM 6068]